MVKKSGKKTGQGLEKSGNKEAPETPKRRNRRKQRSTPTPEKSTKKKRQNQSTPDQEEFDLEQLEKDPLSQIYFALGETPSPAATNADSDTDDEQKLSGKERPSTNRRMEEDKYKEDDASMDDDATAEIDNTHTEEHDDENWIPAFKKKVYNPYQKQFLAKPLPTPLNRGFNHQWRANFCITIEPENTKEETEGKVNEAVEELVKILVSKGAELLPWKEAEYDKNHVVNKGTIDQFQSLPYQTKRKRYIDSGYFKTDTRKVYLYLYLGLPREYVKFRPKVESLLKDIGIVWYVQTLQAERRYPIGYVKGSHQRTDIKRVKAMIKENTNLDVEARWRMWTLPSNSRPNGVKDDKVYAIYLETDQRYSAQERRLIYRMFGTNPDLRNEIALAIETTLSIELIPYNVTGMIDKAKEGATAQRAQQRDINKGLREKTMYDTVKKNINTTLSEATHLTLRELIMTTKQQNSDKPLFVAVDQPPGYDAPTLTFINGLQGQVERFVEGARQIMEANAKKYFRADFSLSLKNQFTDGANSNYDEQEYDDETGGYTTKEDQHLIKLADQNVIDWSDYAGNPIDPSRWVLDEQMDEYSMDSRLEDESIATQNTNETIYPEEATDTMMETAPNEPTQYTAADDRDSGTSARKT